MREFCLIKLHIVKLIIGFNNEPDTLTADGVREVQGLLSHSERKKKVTNIEYIHIYKIIICNSSMMKKNSLLSTSTRQEHNVRDQNISGEDRSRFGS